MKPHAPNLPLPRARRLAALGRVPREVFELLAASDIPLKAYDLLWRLQNQRAQSAPPTTVYRAVAILLQAGLIHKIEGPGSYVVCTGPEEDHEPVFLLCEQCHKAVETIAAATEKQIDTAIADAGFHAHRRDLVIRGICQMCGEQGMG